MVASSGSDSSTADTKEDWADRRAGGTRIPNHRSGSPLILLSLAEVSSMSPFLGNVGSSAEPSTEDVGEASACAWFADPKCLGAESLADIANATLGSSAARVLSLSIAKRKLQGDREGREPEIRSRVPTTYTVLCACIRSS
jgi:hypothetical protein